jgi:N6-L-threonylcarbamoyladenine synthase
MAIIDEALDTAGKSLKEMDYIAVTYAPGLIGALLVGVSVAKGLSFGSGIPLIPVHHIKGHIYANFMENHVELPAVALVVSGGHTNIVYMDENHRFEILGGTLDDAIGEAYDKVARVLGLNYPGGPEIDRLSKSGNGDSIKLPESKLENPYDFSFSGIKTSIINLINMKKMKNEEINAADIAASFQKTAVKIVVEKSIRAAKDKGVKTILVAGGVAANSLLRSELTLRCRGEGITAHFPSFKLCTDNGAMIAAAAYFGIKTGNKKPAESNLNGFAEMDIDKD